LTSLNFDEQAYAKIKAEQKKMKKE